MMRKKQKKIETVATVSFEEAKTKIDRAISEQIEKRQSPPSKRPF